MSEISITRTHHSTLPEAKKVADKVAAKLGNDYQLQSSWAGDVLHFERSGVHGTLAVNAKEFKIHLKLGFLMAAFKGPIQKAIEENLEKMLKPASAGKKPSTKAKK